MLPTDQLFHDMQGDLARIQAILSLLNTPDTELDLEKVRHDFELALQTLKKSWEDYMEAKIHAK